MTTTRHKFVQFLKDSSGGILLMAIFACGLIYVGYGEGRWWKPDPATVTGTITQRDHTPYHWTGKSHEAPTWSVTVNGKLCRITEEAYNGLKTGQTVTNLKCTQN